MNRRFIATTLAATGLVAFTLTPAMAARTAHVRPATDTIQGQGSSFVAPLFSASFPHYSNVSVNYQATGSGAGQNTLNNGTTDFGSFDVPMGIPGDSFSNLSKITQFPDTLGGVAVEYNLPFNRTNGQLHLTGSVIAKIYMGKITQWSDPQLTKKNPGLKKLKGTSEDSIIVVHRQDSSGTTYAFTDFLSHTSGAWAHGAGLGASKLPAWPVGLPGLHSSGVDALVDSHPGAIGYVETNYAISNGKIPAFIQNKSGIFVQPLAKKIIADANSVKHFSLSHFSIVYAKGKNNYPISTYSWSGMYTKGSDWANGSSTCQETVNLFKWQTTTGQKYASPNYYVPLPKIPAAYAKAQLKKFKCSQ